MEDRKTIKIGGREIPLFYSSYELEAIQKDIGCTGFELKSEVFGLRLADEDDPQSIVLDCATDPERIRKLGTLIRILGNAGLEEEGEKPDLTDRWVLRHIRPAMVMPYAIAVLIVVNEGNRFEVPPEAESGPVDEGLEEEQAKKAQGN